MPNAALRLPAVHFAALRFLFAGMPRDQVAATLELSVYQVRQKWAFARAWLKAILEES